MDVLCKKKGTLNRFEREEIYRLLLEEENLKYGRNRKLKVYKKYNPYKLSDIGSYDTSKYKELCENNYLILLCGRYKRYRQLLGYLAFTMSKVQEDEKEYTLIIVKHMYLCNAISSIPKIKSSIRYDEYMFNVLHKLESEYIIFSKNKYMPIHGMNGYMTIENKLLVGNQPFGYLREHLNKEPEGIILYQKETQKSKIKQIKQKGVDNVSHFSVLVLSEFELGEKDLETIMHPYDENLEVPKYVKYTKAQLIEKAKKDIKEYAEKGCYAEYLKNPEEYREKHKNNPGHLKYVEEDFPKKLKMSDEELYQDSIKYYEPENILPNGSVTSTYNPKSKWDWYVVGGRWSGELKLKTPQEDDCVCADEAFAKDVDFSLDEKVYKRACRFWEINIEGAEATIEEKEEYFCFYTPKYYLERYKNKENYARAAAAFSTFAVITPDGVWHEQGSMGWFGVSGETHEEARQWEEEYHKFIDDAIKNNWYMTIVDCHI